MGCNVINIKDKKNISGEVYIGRPSKWGNPFVIGIHGNREQVIKLYEDYLFNNYDLMANMGELEGKTLVCYCKPEACHGDVLALFVNNLNL
jgi:hypothetical protein|tara:strand:+ start:341 stop:613 length:273 start_codon:yes stop_codon:yes gene_type:complete